MQVLGKDEIARFLDSCGSPTQSGEVKSFLYEVTYRHWTSVGTLLADYPEALSGNLPEITFVLCGGVVHVDCVVDFDSGILLVLTCKDRSRESSGKRRGSERAAA